LRQVNVVPPAILHPSTRHGPDAQVWRDFRPRMAATSPRRCKVRIAMRKKEPRGYPMVSIAAHRFTSLRFAWSAAPCRECAVVDAIEVSRFGVCYRSA
jgi:hypothetical protein